MTRFHFTTRAALIFAMALPLTAVLGSSARADNGDVGSPDPMSGVMTALVFIGIPLAVAAVVWALVLATNRGGAAVLRRDREWEHPPTWLGDSLPSEVPDQAAPGGGGTSARW